MPQLKQKWWLQCLLVDTLFGALDFSKPSQHSVSHLSDRCLFPKQWIITVLHLSVSTHLVWSAGFLLLSLVIAWHPQCAYQAPFLGMPPRCFVFVWLCLCLWPSVSFSPPIFSFNSLLLCVFLSVCLTQAPQSSEQVDYVKEKTEKQKRKRCSAAKGIGAEVIYLHLFWCLDWMFTLRIVLFFFSIFHFSLVFRAYFLYTQLLCVGYTHQ